MRQRRTTQRGRPPRNPHLTRRVSHPSLTLPAGASRTCTTPAHKLRSRVRRWVGACGDLRTDTDIAAPRSRTGVRRGAIQHPYPVSGVPSARAARTACALRGEAACGVAPGGGRREGGSGETTKTIAAPGARAGARQGADAGRYPVSGATQRGPVRGVLLACSDCPWRCARRAVRCAEARLGGRPRRWTRAGAWRLAGLRRGALTGRSTAGGAVAGAADLRRR